jgi:hypothetical protein
MLKEQQKNYSIILKKEAQKENSLWLLKVAKINSFFFAVIFVFVSCAQVEDTNFTYQEGDIILQSLNSSQCDAVRKATESYYSHCGIVLKDGDDLMVYEAVGPVIKSTVESFTSAGINGHYVVLRMKSDSGLNFDSMSSYCVGELGKSYDSYFNWGDEEQYCSELVWKAYNSAGIQLCATRPLREYNLTSPLVQTIMKQRYGNDIPTEEPMVAPSDLFSSTLLEVIYENPK